MRALVTLAFSTFLAACASLPPTEETTPRQPRRIELAMQMNMPLEPGTAAQALEIVLSVQPGFPPIEDMMVGVAELQEDCSLLMVGTLQWALAEPHNLAVSELNPSKRQLGSPFRVHPGGKVVIFILVNGMTFGGDVKFYRQGEEVLDVPEWGTTRHVYTTKDLRVVAHHVGDAHEECRK